MFTRLLVPLDGSRLAETVLPAAAFLATHLDASVVLIHVIERDAPSEVHGDAHLRTESEADAYLRNIAAAFPPQVRVETHVHTGGFRSITRSISDHVTELGSDLILMCMHGRSGPRQFLFGSIAQQVGSLGSVAVLFFRAPAVAAPPAFALTKLLVPLDGEPAHEHSLPVAEDLALRCAASIHLLRVVPTYGNLSGPWVQSSRLLPGTTTRMLEMTVQEAHDYLENARASIKQERISVTTEVLRGDPPDVIAEAAEMHRADLIIVGTHGKVGTDAFWSGSVTAKLCRRCQIPVLLIPASNGK
jgi:nucleotide-binding universal stress UspA family protein